MSRRSSRSCRPAIPSGHPATGSSCPVDRAAPLSPRIPRRPSCWSGSWPPVAIPACWTASVPWPGPGAGHDAAGSPGGRGRRRGHRAAGPGTAAARTAARPAAQADADSRSSVGRHEPADRAAGGERHRAAVLEGLEQWIRRLADMLTASRGLEDALEVSARSAPAAIRAPVTALVGRLSARTGTEAALRAFAADVDDPAGDRIAAALIIATGRRGGGARDVLNALAVMLARDVAARREIEAERAQHRTTVKWVTAFVAAFTIFAVLNRAYSAPYGTFAGQVVLGLVLGLYAAGLAWLHRLGSSPAPGRFLNGPDQLADASPRGTGLFARAADRRPAGIQP